MQRCVPPPPSTPSLVRPLGCPAGPSSTEDSASANDEIIRERLLRELTQEYATLLKELATRTLEAPGGAAAAAAAAGGGPGGTGSGGGAAGGGKSVLEWLLETDPGTGFAAITTAVAGMCWRDEAAYRFAMLARTLVRCAAAAPSRRPRCPRDARRGQWPRAPMPQRHEIKPCVASPWCRPAPPP